MKLKKCIYIVIFCCLMPAAWAYEPENVPLPAVGSLVSNPDGILSETAVQQINSTCLSLYRQTDVELAVVAIQDMNGYEAADFAQRLFMHWGIGDKQRNTGVLILLATDSRDIRIQTGGGVEGLLPDATCDRILGENMVPYLSNDQWDEGLLAGAQAIKEVLSSPEAQAELLLGFTPADTELSDAICVYLMIACCILILFASLLYRDMRPRVGETDKQRMQRQSGTWQLLIAASIFFPLPVCFLAFWFYRHGGKAISAMLSEAAKKAAEEERQRNQNDPWKGGNNGGFYIGGFGGGSGRSSGGFGGGFGGFGGGASFGGGAGRKF